MPASSRTLQAAALLTLLVTPLVARGQQRFKSAQDEYDESYVWFDAEGKALLGKDAYPLEGSALFNYIGRRDLGRRYEDTVHFKSVLGWGGLLAIGMGLTFSASILVMDVPLHLTCVQPSSFCDAQRPFITLLDSLVIAGVAGAGLGVASGLLGLAISPDPVSESEAHRLVDDYNGKLRKKLGLPVEPRASRPPGPSFRLAAFALPGGAAAQLAVSF